MVIDGDKDDDEDDDDDSKLFNTRFGVFGFVSYCQIDQQISYIVIDLFFNVFYFEKDL